MKRKKPLFFLRAARYETAQYWQAGLTFLTLVALSCSRLFLYVIQQSNRTPAHVLRVMIQSLVFFVPLSQFSGGGKLSHFCGKNFELRHETIQLIKAILLYKLWANENECSGRNPTLETGFLRCRRCWISQ